MCIKGYNDRLRLLNTHSLEYRRLCVDLVLCFQLLCNGIHNSLMLSLNLLIIELEYIISNFLNEVALTLAYKPSV